MKKIPASFAIVLNVIVTVLLCISLIGALLFYSDTLENNLYNDNLDKLNEISNRNVKVLTTQINGQANAMTEVAARIAVPSDWNIDYTIYTLNKVMERYPFKRMGLVFPDGRAYISSGEEYTISENDMSYLNNVFKGETYISNTNVDAFDGSSIISIHVPVYKSDEIVAILTASYETDVLQDMLNVSFFDGQGYSYIVRANGDIIADSTAETSFVNVENIFTSMLEASPRNTSPVEQMKKDMSVGENGYISFANIGNYYMCYTSVGINDWYLLSVIPASVIDSSRRSIMLSTYLLCTVICVIFTIIIIIFTKRERKKKSELQKILYVDPITKGYSFQRFCIEAKEKLHQDNRNAALIVLDIEKFKVINEMFGYDEGDRVLKYIWTLLQRWSRDGEIYSRWIADRFNVLAFYENEEELTARLNNLADDIMNDRTERRNGFILRPTIGVYRIIDRELDIQSMQNNASIAHSTIKGDSHGSCVAFYNEEYKEDILSNKILEDKLVKAYDNKEFVVFYQPKYDAATQKLVGAEALVRWKQADGSYIPPFRFIPTAEKNGFITKLDKYVFKMVCEDQKRWLDEGREIVPISVNLSRQHLYNPKLVEEYQKMVVKSGVPIDKLELEITESALFENHDEFLSVINKLHGVGFRILMDDFGTGYSSLMMLKSIPIDVMKLDKSFVDDYSDKKGEKIISSVTQLAKSMEIEVTAEGVETEEQYKFMRDLGCDMIQGYYFAKPMPVEEFDKLI
ncbi:MAG: GGDEF domain-containing protein [Oscillospiraceae bacterium]|nr:GGDEF domain-containing protein [Oscillospiraceae bacterium]